MARLLLIDVENDDVREIECSALDDYYENLGCDCFDIAYRAVGDRAFDIFCDDEGLLKNDSILSAVTSDGEPVLVGNLIFANHYREGNTTSLSDDDIAIILSHIKNAMTFRNGEPYFHKIVTGVDY